jgi:hypothetical protein
MLLLGAFVTMMMSQVASAGNSIADAKNGVASALGISVENAGIFLGISILTAVGIALTVGCRINPLLTTIILFAVTSIMCIFELLPVWIVIIFFVIMAAMFARFISGYMTGSGTTGEGGV